MRLQISNAIRDAFLDELVRRVGPTPVLELFAGALPARCTETPAGALLARGTLPLVWISAAHGGTTTKQGSWVLEASSAGTIGCFRISRLLSPHECCIQGDVGKDGAMRIDSLVVEAKQKIEVKSFVLVAPNP